MMKGKLMKSLFRGKGGVPRTPGPSNGYSTESQEDGDVGEADKMPRLRVHSEENNSNNSLDSPNSDSPRSWPSTFATPMSYIKGKRRKTSRFHVTSPLELDKTSEDVFGGAEEHNLSQSIHSETASFLSVESPPGGEDVMDGVASSKQQNPYQVHIQQLKLQVEVQQKMIADYESEKMKYEEKVSTLSTELAAKRDEAKSLRDEIHSKKRLEIMVQDLKEKLQQMENENRNLQQRVNETSPLTDHQKELLLQNRIKSVSAPPSIMAGSIEGQTGAALAGSGEELACDWEVKSCGGSSVHSQVSVACLQDKLVQMEENNYSTHEELQATLQELTDLQHQLEELQSENRTLGEEKSIIYESLCEQTEKLEACRSQLESTRQLLLQKEDSASKAMDNSEREKKLLDVLKSAQDERDRLDVKAKSLTATVDELRGAVETGTREMGLVQERMAFLEKTVHTVRMEKEHAERELNDLKNDLSCKNMELSRLQTLNENFKTKLEELEAARDAVDKTEIEAKLDELRREKDGLETVLNETSQQKDKVEYELGKVKDSLTAHKKEMEFQIRAKTEQIEILQNKIHKLEEEKNNMIAELQELQNSVTELEVKCQHHLTDKRELKASLCESQKCVTDMQSRLMEVESQLTTERTRRVSDAEEWKQFQADLLMTVRVANDFQTEAQTNLEAISHETSELRDKIRQLETENDRLKAQAVASRTQVTTRSTPLSTVTPTQGPESISGLRTKYLTSRSQDNKATVKGLIESIESAAKARTANYSRSTSAPAMPTLSPISENPGGAGLVVGVVGGTKSVFVPTSPLALSERKNAAVSSSSPLVGSLPVVSSVSPLKPQSAAADTVSNVVGGAACGSSPSAANVSAVVINGTSATGGGPVATTQSGVSAPSSSPVSILANKNPPLHHRPLGPRLYDSLGANDPLASLVKNGGSKRNALLKWCQAKTAGYVDVDITNFSSSWNDGMALCAILHTYVPDKIPYGTLKASEKRRNFTIAFEAAESVGIATSLNLTEMVSIERPDWQQVMTYVTNVYKHFET